MKYQAFTNDSLAMMHHGARGALAVDDELSKLGEEPRFKVRSTSDWAEHAADLEAEMMRRGMRFEAIDLSTPVRLEPVAQETVAIAPAEAVSTEAVSTESASADTAAAEPTRDVSSEAAPMAPALPLASAPDPVSDRAKPSAPSDGAGDAADHDTRLRSRIAAVLKIRS